MKQGNAIAQHYMPQHNGSEEILKLLGAYRPAHLHRRERKKSTFCMTKKAEKDKDEPYCALTVHISVDGSINVFAYEA